MGPRLYCSKPSVTIAVEEVVGIASAVPRPPDTVELIVVQKCSQSKFACNTMNKMVDEAQEVLAPYSTDPGNFIEIEF